MLDPIHHFCDLLCFLIFPEDRAAPGAEQPPAPTPAETQPPAVAATSAADAPAAEVAGGAGAASAAASAAADWQKADDVFG